MLTTIPFSGFYNSLHSDEVDQVTSQMFTDSQTGCEQNDGLHDRLQDSCNYGLVYKLYATSYAEQFLHKHAITGVFESMTSPREYNFTTDRIFAEIPHSELIRIYTLVDKSILNQAVRDNFTSCDGFSSFYSNKRYTWGPLRTWDHNQLGALLHAYAIQESRSGEFGMWEEYDVMEDTRCNGNVEQWIDLATPNISRLYNVHEYLEQRAVR